MTYTAPRQIQIFDHTTTEAQEGDYFHIPGQPIFRVLARVDSGDYAIYFVQQGKEKPEQWDLMKPAAELFEQERNRVEAYEEEMSAIIHEAAQEEIEEALGLLSPLVAEYDWLTEPIGADMAYIFGMTGEQQAEALPPVETGYNDPDWTDKDTEF